jgi:hypothetical protein
MAHIYNIALAHSEPLYASYTVYHGIEICVTGKTIEAVREGLEEQLNAIEVIEMAEAEAEVDSLVDRLFPHAGEMDDLREQMAVGL